MANTGNPADNTNFKPALIVVCVIAVIILLIANSCGGGDERSSRSSTSTTSQQSSQSMVPAPTSRIPATAPVDQDAQFIQDLAQGGVTYSAPDTAAIQVAQTTCDNFAKGWDVDLIRGIAMEAGGFDYFSATYFIYASIMSYCPEYESAYYN